MTIEEWAKDFKSYVNALDMQKDDYKGIMEYIDDVLAILKEQNVIRCCDCRWWDKHTYECNNDDILRLIKDCGCGLTFKTEPDWFCAGGAYKENNNE